MSKQEAKNIFKDGETKWEEKTMKEYTDILYEDIDSVQNKLEQDIDGLFYIVETKLPSKWSAVTTVPEEFGNGNIISSKIRNAGGQWSEIVQKDGLWMRAELRGRSLYLEHGVHSSLVGNDVEIVILRKL